MRLISHLEDKRYSEVDLRVVPTYAVAEVARYLHVPESTLRSWFKGRKGYKPVLVPHDPERRLLSFINLVEANTLAALRRKYPQMRIHADIWPAVKHMRQVYGEDHPLAGGLLNKTDGKSLLYDHLSDGARHLINASRGGQKEFEQVVETHIKQVEVDRAGIIRFFPVPGRRTIAVSPAVAFGQPVIHPGAIPTRIIAGLKAAGDSVEQIAEDFDCSVELVRDALLFEDEELRAPA